MKTTLQSGLKATRRFEVDERRTIDFLANDGEMSTRVYATPALVEDIERTCREMLLEHLDNGEDSLGTEVNIKHLAPTMLGMWAEVTAEITRLDDRAVQFAFTVRDPIDAVVAKGSHSRFVIDVAKTIQRLQGKEEAFSQAS